MDCTCLCPRNCQNATEGTFSFAVCHNSVPGTRNDGVMGEWGRSPKAVTPCPPQSMDDPACHPSWPAVICNSLLPSSFPQQHISKSSTAFGTEAMGTVCRWGELRPLGMQHWWPKEQEQVGSSIFLCGLGAWWL